MSYEQAVRERHAFEDRIRNFLNLASVMTDRELELALSRLADMLTHMGDQPHVRIRGEVVKQYLGLRRVGQRKERALKRMFFKPVPGMVAHDPRIETNSSDYYVRCIANFPLLVEGQLAPPGSTTNASFDQTVLMLAP